MKPLVAVAISLLWVIACAAVVSATRPVRPGTPNQATPNVLVVVLDDWGWTERAALTSLDALAADGVTFTRFITTPVCSPSRYAMLTGRYPRRAGIGTVIDPYNPLTSSSPAPDRLDMMLPEILKPTHSTALIGKWHVGRASVDAGTDLLPLFQSGPYVSGFDVWMAGTGSTVGHGTGATGYYDWVQVDNEVVTYDSTEYATNAQLADFLDWWQGTSEPKFAVLAWSAPHAPFDAPPGHPSTGTVRTKYMRLVEYLDGAMATALAAVDLSDSYVFVFGDNGTPNDARLPGSPSGIWKGSTHGNSSAFGGGICTPLLIAGPGIDENVTSDRLVSVVDIPATIFELLEVPAPRGFEDSESFADELGAGWTGSAAREWVFTEHYDCVGLGLPPVVDGYDDVAIVGTDWKVRTWDADGSGSGNAITRYYDLQNDPLEQSPLTESQAPGSVVSAIQAFAATIPARL